MTTDRILEIFSQLVAIWPGLNVVLIGERQGLSCRFGVYLSTPGDSQPQLLGVVTLSEAEILQYELSYDGTLRDWLRPPIEHIREQAGLTLPK
jgi:hypothetical protein